MDYVEISILYAAERCGICFYNNSGRTEVEANCPFCDDKRNHLSLNTIKNVFRCNRCGEYGNSVTLYSRLNGIDNKTAYKELSRGITSSGAIPVKTLKKQISQQEIKPLSGRHDVYYDMLEILELSAAHRRNLLDRGLSDTLIEQNMYRSVPEKNSMLYAHTVYRLSRGHNLAGIPGFYYQDDKWHMVTNNGMFIPVCDCRGYIQGLQIRLDDTAKRRYRWFSSKRYERGTGASAWMHTAHWNGNKIAFLTEGALKAEIASFLMDKACVIGVPGVNCLGGLPELLAELRITEIKEAFDMDKLFNPYVTNAIVTLKRELYTAGIKCTPLNWDASYKGIDDYCLAQIKNEFVA